MTLDVYIDGGIYPNPGGIASYGVLVLRLEDDWENNGVIDTKPLEDNIVWQDDGIVGVGNGMSNNAAEYAALVKFLEWFDNQPIEDVIIRSDSKMLVNQMQGNWRVSEDKMYFPFFQRALVLMLHNAEAWKGRFTFAFIPREENLADELATRAREEYKAAQGD